MKRPFALWGALVLLGFAACGEGGGGGSAEPPGDGPDGPGAEPDAGGPRPSDGGSNPPGPDGGAPEVPLVLDEDAVSAWVTTADQAQLLAQQPDLRFEAGCPGGEGTIEVDPSTVYQAIDGFGSSLTDASAWLIANRMSEAQRETLLRRLFDAQVGIGLGILRQPIGASDFALGNYSYDDTAPDLSDFSIEHDRAYIVPLLKRIRALNPELLLIGTPWSPPGWMKTSGSMIGGRLGDDHYDDLASYFVRFVQAYEAEGLPIYGVTPQNEPHYEPSGYPGMFMESDEQAGFVGDYLGPAFDAAGIDAKILVWDHNWDGVDYPRAVLEDAEAYARVAGTAFHCYGGDVSAQSAIHDAFPDRDIWLTECSDGTWVGDGAFAGNFVRGVEQLLIGGARNWARGVVKWNLALDEDRGPTNGGCDTCFGTVRIDQADGTVVLEPEYYSLGHASKFVRRGARRVASTSIGGGVETVAFENPDGSHVLVVWNPPGGERSFRVCEGDRSFEHTLPPSAAATFRWGAAEGTVDRSAFTATASASADGDPPEAALDGDPRTRFSTGAAQVAGQTFELDMRASRTVSAITFDSGASEGDFSRGYEIYASEDGAEWGAPIAIGAADTALFTVRFSRRRARYLRVVQTGSAGSWWSIHELDVWR
jgi:glucosylceramidase